MSKPGNDQISTELNSEAGWWTQTWSWAKFGPALVAFNGQCFVKWAGSMPAAVEGSKISSLAVACFDNVRKCVFFRCQNWASIL